MKHKKQNLVSAVILVGGPTDSELYKRCLNSVSWCDEIIKVETSMVEGGFSEWRNFGAKNAKSEWLFYIDTDEEVSEKLKEEILSSIKNNLQGFQSYAIPRNNIFLGKSMKYGGWTADYVVRLIKKSELVKWYGKLHEQPIVRGKIGKLKNKLMHTSHRDLSSMVEKTNQWSEIEADLMVEANHPIMNIQRFISSGFREFWFRGVKKMGFLDSTEGIIEIIYQTYSRLISYMKLWEKQVKGNK